MPAITRNAKELDEYSRGANKAPRAVVMTMGALHDGHLQLVRRGRELVGPNGIVLVTIFVNPLQFGQHEDLEKYPRPFEDDVRMCEAEGVDVIFAPTVDVLYPDGDPHVTVDPGELGLLFEGAARQGHFAGVLTVVAKLLNLTRPDFAVFGEKDYQQLVLISNMVNDLNFDVDVVGVETVRESDGLAMSSRNRYLDSAGRATAVEISRAIDLARQLANQGGQPMAIEQAARDHLDSVPGLEVDYAKVTSVNLGEAPDSGPARLVIAAKVSNTRLLDNAEIVIL